MRKHRLLKEDLTTETVHLFAFGEDYIKISFMICTPHRIIFGRSNQEKLDGRGMWHFRGLGEVYAGFWWRDLK
jgi:hypothetical protein